MEGKGHRYCLRNAFEKGTILAGLLWVFVLTHWRVFRLKTKQLPIVDGLGFLIYTHDHSEPTRKPMAISDGKLREGYACDEMKSYPSMAFEKLVSQSAANNNYFIHHENHQSKIELLPAEIINCGIHIFTL
ncbi:MAG: hypothetical protein ABIS36_04940 [Chryseolinea sp.]